MAWLIEEGSGRACKLRMGGTFRHGLYGSRSIQKVGVNARVGIAEMRMVLYNMTHIHSLQSIPPSTI